MSNEALLIMDMLNDFVLPGAPLEVPDTRKIIPNIKREVERARSGGIPVIFVCDTHKTEDKEFTKFGWPPHAVMGTKGAEVIDELKPVEGDYVIEKTTYSGFYNTKLDELLKKLNVRSVTLTGCATHICIMFTASDSVLRDYNVIVPKDAVAGLSPEDHEAALRIMKNMLGVEIR